MCEHYPCIVLVDLYYARKFLIGDRPENISSFPAYHVGQVSRFRILRRSSKVSTAVGSVCLLGKSVMGERVGCSFLGWGRIHDDQDHLLAFGLQLDSDLVR